MSTIQITCDSCGRSQIVTVRQAHEAHRQLLVQGWTNHDNSNPYGARKKDYCPDCNKQL